MEAKYNFMLSLIGIGTKRAFTSASDPMSAGAVMHICVTEAMAVSKINAEVQVSQEVLELRRQAEQGRFESDRAWAQAFTETTDEEYEALSQMFAEEEQKNGTMPLDFAGK